MINWIIGDAHLHARLRFQGIDIDTIPLSDAYWAVYTYYTRNITDDNDLKRMHTLMDAVPEEDLAARDGVSAADVSYLAQLGLSVEDVRRAEERRAKKREEVTADAGG